MEPRYLLLGEVLVETGATTVRLTALKQQALLVFLILHANEVVPRDVLIDELWNTPPSAARHDLDVHVSGLRHALGAAADDQPVETSSGGYVLHADEEQIDVRRFERLITEARQALSNGAAQRADDRLSGALALWRGAPLPALAGYRFAEFETARLDDLRLTAIEDRCEARLALGRFAEVVDDLFVVVATHPFREHARRLLMIALYRAERQADALEVYRSGRQQLAGELGIEPGQELSQLEELILRHELEPTA